MLDFFADRLKVQQKEAGVRPDLIEAVFSLGGEDDLVRLLARVRALQGFIETPDGANLLAGYKRAATFSRRRVSKLKNVIPAEAGSQTPPVELDSRVRGNDDLEYPPEPAEAALLAALDTAEPRATAAIQVGGFRGGHVCPRFAARANRRVLRKRHRQRS